VKYLTIGRKLVLAGLLFMIPFATVTYMMVSSINSEKVEFAKLELMGTEYYVPLSALLKDLQEHNSAAVNWRSGDASFKDIVAKKTADIEADLAQVDDQDRLLDSSLHTSEQWHGLRTSIETLLDPNAQISAGESLAQHQKVIDATVFMISKVSDNSKLTLDPDMDTYYLMNVVMFQGPATSDFLAQARSLNSLVSANRSGTPEQYNELNRLSILADFSEDGVADSYSRALGFNQVLVPELGDSIHGTSAGVKESTDKIRSLAAAHAVDTDYRDVDASLTHNINQLFELEGRTTTSLSRLLGIRLARWQSTIDYTLVGAGAGLISVLVISFFVLRDITIPLQRLVGIANKIAGGGGNYSIRALKRSDDEIGTLVDAFNEMLGQIQKRDADLNNSQADLEKRVAERTEEVVNSLSLVHATLESTTDGILVTDAEGNPTSYNGKFLEMWKIPDQGPRHSGKRKTSTITSPLSSDYTRFLTHIGELRTDPEKESFDLLELRDGRLFEQYSKPQRVDNKCVGRVWSFRDITERKRAEREMQEMHQQLLDTSRQAGMAEVATSVLHNVGNVLNSVNISCAQVASLVKKSKVENLSKVVEMLAEHSSDLGVFLTSDPKGKQVPAYLGQLSQHLVGQHRTALDELIRLQENIDHIKEIVVMQQSYAKVSGVTESLTITSLLEDAIRLNENSLERHGVDVQREYADVSPMQVQKHKILQILVNLIRNSKHACDESLRTDKRIILRVSTARDLVMVSVIDNGIGIPPENLKSIFGHGFTTKKDGHGFGLHSSALAAKEMGGSLTVESNGRGKGATFTLILPYIRTTTNSGNIRRLAEPAMAA
jgi:signal transduction histidine kinase/HAMP domain-containing protein